MTLQHRRRTAGRLTCVGAAFLYVATALGGPAAQRIYEDSKGAVARVDTFDRTDRRIAQGSGFFTASDTLVTNFHVLDGACRVEVTVGESLGTGSTILFHDPLQDIAVLRIVGMSGAPVPLGTSDSIVPGTTIVTLGYPLADHTRTLSLSEGIVAAVREHDANRVLIQFTAPVSPGSSGGPLFNEAGDVIGITTSTLNPLLGAQNVNYAIPIDVIRRFDPGRKPLPLESFCGSRIGQETPFPPVDDPRDDQQALSRFKEAATFIIDAAKAVAGSKQSDKSVGYGTRARTFTLSWLEVRGDYSYNVYRVDPESSVVITFMGYVDIPVKIWKQRIKVVAPGEMSCDGLYFYECLKRGATIKKRKGIRVSFERTVWGLAFQEGRWIASRMLTSKSAASFMRHVERVDIQRIYQELVKGDR